MRALLFAHVGKRMPKHKEDPEELRPIGERIAQARAAAGLTQGELGDLAGLDTQTISKLERGLQAVGSMPMRRMAVGLRVSMDRSEDLGKDSPDVMPLKAPRKPNRGAR